MRVRCRSRILSIRITHRLTRIRIPITYRVGKGEKE